MVATLVSCETNSRTVAATMAAQFVRVSTSACSERMRMHAGLWKQAKPLQNDLYSS